MTINGIFNQKIKGVLVAAELACADLHFAVGFDKARATDGQARAGKNMILKSDSNI